MTYINTQTCDGHMVPSRAMESMVNTKSRHKNRTRIPPHVVISTGELVEYFDTRAAEMR